MAIDKQGANSILRYYKLSTLLRISIQYDGKKITEYVYSMDYYVALYSSSLRIGKNKEKTRALEGVGYREHHTHNNQGTRVVSPVVSLHSEQHPAVASMW